jgi:hypothetical protein
VVDPVPLPAGQHTHTHSMTTHWFTIRNIAFAKVYTWTLWSRPIFYYSVYNTAPLHQATEWAQKKILKLDF